MPTSLANRRDAVVKLYCLALVALLALGGIIPGVQNDALQPASGKKRGVAMGVTSLLAPAGQHVLAVKAELARQQRREKIQSDAQRLQQLRRLRPVNTKLAAGGAPLALAHGGLERSFHLLVPPAAIAKALTDPRGEVEPVVYLHCFGCSCAAPAGRAVEEWDTLAEQRGFVLVRPCGDVVGSVPSWNAGACCGEAKAQGLDDAGFVQAVTQ